VPITELLTTSLAKNTMGGRQNTYSKIINVADCKTSKKRSLAVKYLILIMFNYATAKTRTLYKSTDGPAGRPADNPPNPDRLGDLHGTVPELTVRVYCQPGRPIWQRSSSDPDPDPKGQSGTVANTRPGGGATTQVNHHHPTGSDNLHNNQRLFHRERHQRHPVTMRDHKVPKS